jgi:hypothetical protein
MKASCMISGIPVRSRASMETPRKMVPNHRNYTEKRRAAQALAQKMLMLFF